MKNLIIIGARGMGRETFSLAKNCQGYGTEYQVKGFLDDHLHVLDDFTGYPPILGSVEAYEVQEHDVFICALGAVYWKKFYAEQILAKGGLFINLIHPSVTFSDNVTLGTGLIICQGACLSNEVSVGDFVIILNYSGLGHNTKVGDWCHIGAYSFTGGFSVLENEATLHVRATILPNIQVRKNAVIGACSLVTKNVKENTTVFGVPAKVLEF
ncbi:acetyltransferase [Pedobacter sp. MC2016-14]|uniref:acetyltransferase n=1 Tax=Pedobacter sp. MC2016-14 TaxID=2897327 RepID=UPI001E6077B8|nr:acetyltransferase [Pedobacter sp. MC2016-14]MCD0486899.1 acetyltransferase [Pedobacter sp. MC2016-14]